MANLDRNKKKIAEQVASWSENEFAELVKTYDKTHKAKYSYLKLFLKKTVYINRQILICGGVEL